MRKTLLYLVIGLFALFGTGCDSAEDGPTDAERIVGQWRVTSVRDASGDQTSEFRRVGTLTLDFRAGNAFSLVFDAVAEGGDQAFSGQYTLQQQARSLTLQGTVAGLQQGILARYQFSGDDALNLTVPVAVINFIAGTNFTGELTIQAERGGS